MLNVDVQPLSVEVTLFIDQTSFSEFRRSQVTTQADLRSAIEIASGRLLAGRPPAWTLPRRPHRRSPGAKRPLRRGFNRMPEQLPSVSTSPAAGALRDTANPDRGQHI